jgi:hypothetical protein
MNRRGFLARSGVAAAGSSLAFVRSISRAVAAENPDPVEIAPFPRAQVQSLYTQTIWTNGRHNAFPGIARVGDFYYVAFRTADSHQGTENTRIVVIRSAAAGLKEWEKVAEFTRDGDVRDPLLFDNHGRVQVVFHAQEDYYSQSADGVTWSEPRELETEFVEPAPDSRLVFTSKRRWLFRIRRGPDGAFYSLGRCGIIGKESHSAFGLILFRSEDGVQFKGMHTYGEGPTAAMGKNGVGSGWGHEADVAWTPDGTLVAAIRNSEDGVVALGSAPLGPWKAYTTGAYDFGGPALHTTAKGGMLLAARAFSEKKRLGFPAVCKVWTVTSDGVENPWIVPSGGDCAYQSFADGPGDEVLLVYYSSHEFPQPKGVGRNPANIYLAHLTLQHAAPS